MVTGLAIIGLQSSALARMPLVLRRYGKDECVCPYVVRSDSSQIPCRALTDFDNWSKAILPRMPETGPNLSEALRRYWGYHEFRPKQENVIRSLLAAHDTCVVMPTAAGTSLCYPLPAVSSGRTAVA